MNYTTIFTDLDDFRSYADGLQADTAYRQLHPSIRSTAMEMEKVITRAAFEAIASGSWAPAATEEHPNPVAISLTDGKELLKELYVLLISRQQAKEEWIAHGTHQPVRGYG